MKVRISLFLIFLLSINLFEESLALESTKSKNYVNSLSIQKQIISSLNTSRSFDSKTKSSEDFDTVKIAKVSHVASSILRKTDSTTETNSFIQENSLSRWRNDSKLSNDFIDLKPVERFDSSPRNVLKEKVSNRNVNVQKTLNGEEIVPNNVDVASNNKNTKPIALVQSSTGDLMRKPVGFSDLDFSTPSSPGAAMINYKGDFGSVSTPNEIAVKLLNGLSSDGKFQPGVAIDISPYLLASGTGFTLADYRKPDAGFQRFLANTKISIATAGSEKEALLGIGAEFILLNEGDPRFDETLFNDFREILKNQPSPDDDLIAFNNSIKQKIITAKEQAKKRSEQKETWTLGIGTSLVSSTGRYYDFRGNGMGVWTTYKRGMGGNSELILHGNYRSSERTSDRVGGYVNVDTVTLGTRIRTGDDKFKFSLETAYNFESQGGTTSNSYLSLGLGAEPKISDNLWLSLSMTGNIGRQNGNDVQIFSGLKWNFNSGK